MSKRYHRFGMEYFLTRPLWARPNRDGSGISTMRLVIRDTHQEWDVRELWTLYAQRNQIEQRTQPETESETKDSTPSVEADNGTGSGPHGGTAE